MDAVTRKKMIIIMMATVARIMMPWLKVGTGAVRRRFRPVMQHDLVKHGEHPETIIKNPPYSR